MSILTERFSASKFQDVFALLSVKLLRLASPSGVSFSRQTSTSCFWRLWLRGWCGLWFRFCTVVTLMPESTLVSLRTLSFFFPRVTNTFSSFNTTQSLSTLDHCNCFDFSHAWRQSLAIEVSDLCFSSSLSSISYNWASISFD